MPDGTGIVDVLVDVEVVVDVEVEVVVDVEVEVVVDVEVEVDVVSTKLAVTEPLWFIVSVVFWLCALAIARELTDHDENVYFGGGEAYIV